MNDRMQQTTAQHQRECDQGGIARAEARGSLGGEDAARFQNRLRDLDNLLNELTGLHEELLEVLQHKLVAMRQNGVDTINVRDTSSASLIQGVHTGPGASHVLGSNRKTKVVGGKTGPESESSGSTVMSGCAPITMTCASSLMATDRPN